MIAGAKKRPERRMMLSGFAVAGGAPTSKLSSAASILHSVLNDYAQKVHKACAQNDNKAGAIRTSSPL